MKKIILILLLLHITGCRTKPMTQENDSITFEIDPSKTVNIPVSAIVDSLRLIRLETTDDNLINQIRKVFHTDNRIIVYDSEANQVFIFDSRGKYLNKIFNIGKGPGEYIKINECMFDPIEHTIIIYDGISRKMLFYNIEGELKKEIKDFNNKASIRNMANLPNGNFLCYTYDFTTKQVGKEASGLWETDPSGNFIRSFFSYEELYPGPSRGPSYLYVLPGGRIGLSDAIFNDLSYFEDGGLNKYIKYDIKGNERQLKYKGLTFTDKEGFTMCYGSHFKERYIVSLWIEANNDFKNFHTIHSMKDNSNIVVSSEDFWSDPAIVRGFLTDYDDPGVLLVTLSGWSVNQYMKSGKGSPDIITQLGTDGMTEDQILNINPVLELLYLKK